MGTLAENDRLTAPVTANAGQTDFAADFPLLRDQGGDPTGVFMRRVRGGVETILDLADFTIPEESISDNGFTCVLPAEDVLADDTYQIFGLYPAERERAHTPGGATRTATLEGDAVQFAAQLQEARRDIDRAYKVPLGAAPTDISVVVAASAAAIAAKDIAVVAAAEALAAADLAQGAVSGLMAVATAAAMKLVDTVLHKAVWLGGTRPGVFVWNATTPIAQHQSDVDEIWYVAPSDVAIGAWVRATDYARFGRVMAPAILVDGELPVPATWNNDLGQKLWRRNGVTYALLPTASVLSGWLHASTFGRFINQVPWSAVDMEKVLDWTNDGGTTPTAYYTSDAGNDITGDGSIGTPWLHPKKALTVIRALASGYRAHLHVLNDDLSTTAGESWPTGDGLDWMNIKGKLKISFEGNGGTYSYISGRRRSWVNADFDLQSETGGIWSSVTATGLTAFQACWHGKWLDDIDMPLRMPCFTSLAELQAAPQGFYLNPGVKQYWKTLDGLMPNVETDFYPCEGNTNITLFSDLRTNAGQIVIKGLRAMLNAGAAEGGALRYRPTDTYPTYSTYANGVTFIDCRISGSGNQGFQNYDAGRLLLSRCSTRGTQSDGANYQSYVSAGDEAVFMNIQEWDCDFGEVGPNASRSPTAPSGSDNGSSVHRNAYMLRVRTKCGDGYGPPLVDTGGVQSWNVDCQIGASTHAGAGTAPGAVCSIETSYSAVNGRPTRMYLDGCSVRVGAGQPAIVCTDVGEAYVRDWRGPPDATITGSKAFDWAGAAL